MEGKRMSTHVGYKVNEPMEAHYFQNFGKEPIGYILTAFVNDHGMVQYNLSRMGSHYGESIPAGTFPRKAVEGWQSEVIAKLMSDERRFGISGCIEITKLV